MGSVLEPSLLLKPLTHTNIPSIQAATVPSTEPTGIYHLRDCWVTKATTEQATSNKQPTIQVSTCGFNVCDSDSESIMAAIVEVRWQ